MIKLIIQISDIHIRNFQRLGEYAEQLQKFVDKCKEITKDYERNEVRIVICGDLVHSKNQISNELIMFTSYFLRQLEEISTVLVIAGNHDLLVNNTSRTDTLTALFSTANFEDCKFLDEMLEYKSGVVEDDNIVWALYSIYDDFTPPILDGLKESGKTIIGLYHGMIVGASLDNGASAETGVDRGLFNGCDVVMAGDIHKRQVLINNGTKIVYSGSLMQQTFGETVSNHGFVVWNVENMEHTFVDLESDYGLYSLSVDNIDDIDNNNEKLLNA